MSFDNPCHKCAHFGKGEPKFSILTDCVHYYCPVMKAWAGAYSTCNHFKEAAE